MKERRIVNSIKKTSIFILLFVFPGFLFGCGKGETVTPAVPTPTVLTESIPAEPSETVSPMEYSDGEPSLSELRGPLAIKEIILFGEDSVEIENISDSPVNLGTYYLSDKNDNRQKLSLPDQTLNPGELFVSTGLSLSLQGERLWLSDKEGTVIDYANVEGVPAGGSYGRMAGETEWSFFTKPTPGAPNEGGFSAVCPSPIASVESGIFNGIDSLVVELVGSGIHYTLDGSAPNEFSPEYTGPFTLHETTVIRAVSVADDVLPSREATFSYIINENHTMPVLSLVTDQPEKFSSMCISGNKNAECVGALSLLDENGVLFSNACGIKLKGYSSLSDEKKSFNIHFRGKYGDGKLENVDLFGNGPSDYASISIRSGQDTNAAYMRDELVSQLCLGATDKVPTLNYRYCILYVNGQYFGIYALKEHMDEEYYARLKNVSESSVETVHATIMPDENPDLYSALQILHADEITEDVFAQFCEKFDIDSLVDWFIIYGYFGNTDSLNQTRYYRSSEEDGKWRICLFDSDLALRSPYFAFRNQLGYEGLANQQTTSMCLHLISYAPFREMVLARYAEMIRGPLSDERYLEELENLYSELGSEMPRNCERWGLNYHRWVECVQQLRDYTSEEVNYQRQATETLCSYLNVSQEDKEYYFGQ